VNVEPRWRSQSSLYADAIAAEICERLGKGEALQAIRRDERIPAARMANESTERRPEFAAIFARARVCGFDASAAEALFMADTPVEGVETITKAVGSGEHQPQRPTATGNSSPASFTPHRLPIDAAAAKVGYRRFGGPGGE